MRGEAAGRIVVGATDGIRKDVVGVVDELELARACGTGGVVVGDAVWVRF